MRYGSICSGIEAATVAWHPLGWEPAWFSEIDKFPSDVLKHHYPGVPNHGDFTQILRDDQHPARSVPLDLLVGGTPCQAFSVAGLRRGFDDDRGNLTLEFCRLVGLLRPRWVVWENVPGVLSIDGGRAFGSILGAFRELGYGFAYRVLDAQHLGVPQRRRRVFLVGHSGGDWRTPAAVLFEPEGVFRHTAKIVQARKGTSRAAAKGSGANGPFWNGSDIAEALTTTSDQQRMPDKGRMPVALTQASTAGASYYKGQGSFQSREREFVAIRKVAHGEYTDDGTASTLSARDYKSAADLVVAPAREGPHAVGVPCGFYATAGAHNTGFTEDGSPTLQCESSGWGSVAATIPFAFKSSYFTRGKDGAPSEIVPPLTADADKGDQDPVVLAAVRKNTTAPTLTAANNPSRSPKSSEITAQVAAIFEAAYTVRRLTPVECERLQGFPDDYSQVPIKGKPAADGPRYKALGNSMAVPVMRWIGQRIAKVDALIKA